MPLSSLYVANKADKQSHVILVADSDFYFKDTTTVTAMESGDASHPKITVLKVRPLGDKKRKLLVRYKVEKPKAGKVMGPAGGDVETGAVTITLKDPPATTVVAVAFVDDDGAP